MMISTLWPPASIGGAERYAAGLAAALVRRGHQVGVVTLGVDGPDVVGMVRPWPYALQDWVGQPAWRRLLFHAADVYRHTTGVAVRRAITEFDPDVVHSHAVQGMSIAALAAPSAAGVPHVHTLHDYWLLCQRTSLRHGDAECGRHSPCAAMSKGRDAVLRRRGPDVALAPSAAVAETHRDFRALQGRVEVLHHPAERFAVRRRTSAGPVTFGFLGRLADEKGVGSLLDAFRSVSVPGARLLVAGTGPLAEELTRDVPPTVDLLGHVTGAAKEQFFTDIDCLVVPSVWPEPAGLVVCEAAGRGIPVIATTAGGLPEYVPPSCRHLLCRPGDIAALRAAMATFASDPVAPGVDVSHLPTWDEHVDRVELAYAAAAGRTAQHARRAA
jgi:glycosyltransferase involved in cell wall biosynthesis